MQDLISRQAAIDRIQGTGYADAIKNNLMLILRLLPSAQPERKTGKWIDDNCSECGQYVYHGDARNYCPNCGADMRGGDSE